MMSAEQYIRVHLEKQITDNNEDVYASIHGVRECLINFATMHVRAAVQEICDNACVATEGGGFAAVEVIDKASIQEAYPLTNIK